MRRQWKGILVGLAVGALVAASVPVLAGTGDPIRAGRFNSAGGPTKLRSSAGPTMVFKNTVAGKPAAKFVVNGAGTPAFRVNTDALIPKLNSDEVDDRHAAQLLPLVQMCSNDNIPPGPNWNCDVGLRTPYAGTLVMSGSVDADYDGLSGSDNLWCRFFVDKNSDGDVADPGEYIKYTDRDISVGWSADDEYATCATNAAVKTAAGSQLVRFSVAGIDGNTDVGQGSVWVMWIPD
jgi:hypothetical protein